MYRPLLVLALAVAFTTTALHAQVSLNSVRVVAKDADVIFTVTDAAATAAAAKAAGGTVTREPSQYGTSGIFIAFVADPEGNLIELIQPARR